MRVRPKKLANQPRKDEGEGSLLTRQADSGPVL